MHEYETLLKIYNYIRPFLDIGILAFIFYKVYIIVFKTNGIQIIKGAVLIALAYISAMILKLETILWILNIIAPGLLVCFAIVFQPELRKIFLKLGDRKSTRLNSSH